MKKYLTILVLICYTISYSQTSVKVEYESIIKPRINNNGFNFTQSQKEEIERQIALKMKIPKKFALYYYDGNSFFQEINNETTGQKIENYQLKNKVGFFSLEDYKTEEFYGYYPMDNVSLEFVNETQTIENYLCKLVLYKIGDTVSKVWYTEDIPISTGPFNFLKVPGLVLKVENNNLTCYAIQVSKNCKKEEVKKMNPQLKIYQGEELALKKAEGKEKLLEYSKEKAGQLMESMKRK